MAGDSALVGPHLNPFCGATELILPVVVQNCVQKLTAAAGVGRIAPMCLSISYLMWLQFVKNLRARWAAIPMSWLLCKEFLIIYAASMNCCCPRWSDIWVGLVEIVVVGPSSGIVGSFHWPVGFRLLLSICQRWIKYKGIDSFNIANTGRWLWELVLDVASGRWFWMLALNVRHWLWMFTGDLALNVGSECWLWMLALNVGSECWLWMLALNVGFECWLWMLTLDEWRLLLDVTLFRL